MNVTTVQSSTNQYNVYVGENLRHDLKQYISKEYTSILIITDETVAACYLNDVKNALAGLNVFASIIPSGEKAKSINVFYELHTAAIEHGLDRGSLIVALGGGVVGDVAGFVAATYMRGIDFIQMPTTILAHDSSVGGKVAINHEQGKNLIGNFYPPVSVIFDVQTLHTLDDKEKRSGYAELIKEALLADEAFFYSLIQSNLSSLTNDVLADQINKGIAIKASIVEVDERESGVRKFLNLGHTLGHALESILGYGSWTHGELVGIGILFAFRVSEQQYNITLPFESLYKWMRTNGYPLALPDISTEEILSKMKLDKKTVGTKIQMALLRDIGKPTTADIDDQQLLSYLDSFLQEFPERIN